MAPTRSVTVPTTPTRARDPGRHVGLVEFDRATGSTVDARLTQLVTEDGPFAVTEPVIRDVLGGARTDTCERDLRLLLQRFHLHTIDPAPDFGGAARICRQCRQNGVTPRGLIDCLIAAVAWRNNATLLAYNLGLHRVAGTVGVEKDSASHRGLPEPVDPPT